MTTVTRQTDSQELNMASLWHHYADRSDFGRGCAAFLDGGLDFGAGPTALPFRHSSDMASSTAYSPEDPHVSVHSFGNLERKYESEIWSWRRWCNQRVSGEIQLLW